MPPEPSSRGLPGSRQLDVTRLLPELEEAESLHLQGCQQHLGDTGEEVASALQVLLGPAEQSKEDSRSQGPAVVWRTGMRKGVLAGDRQGGREGRESDRQCLLLGDWTTPQYKPREHVHRVTSKSFTRKSQFFKCPSG